MKPVVMPTCPYCFERYYSLDAEEEKRMKKATATNAALITCPRCKERYYVKCQIRFCASQQP